MLKPIPFTVESFLAKWKAAGGKIKAIAIVDIFGRIGDGNELLFRFKSDMVEFKRKTQGCHILMGRRTADTLGNDLLPNRYPIVAGFGQLYAQSVSFDGGDLWVIGGEAMYRSTLKHCDEVHLTRVEQETPYFPVFPKKFPIEDLPRYFKSQLRSRERIDYCQITKRYYQLVDEVWYNSSHWERERDLAEMVQLNQEWGLYD